MIRLNIYIQTNMWYSKYTNYIHIVHIQLNCEELRGEVQYVQSQGGQTSSYLVVEGSWNKLQLVFISTDIHIQSSYYIHSIICVAVSDGLSTINLSFGYWTCHAIMNIKQVEHGYFSFTTKLFGIHIINFVKLFVKSQIIPNELQKWGNTIQLN